MNKIITTKKNHSGLIFLIQSTFCKVKKNFKPNIGKMFSEMDYWILGFLRFFYIHSFYILSFTNLVFTYSVLHTQFTYLVFTNLVLYTQFLQTYLFHTQFLHTQFLQTYIYNIFIINFLRGVYKFSFCAVLNVEINN